VLRSGSLLIIGTIYGALIQTAMLGRMGLELGASGAIFGLLVIADDLGAGGGGEQDEMAAFSGSSGPIWWKNAVTILPPRY